MKKCLPFLFAILTTTVLMAQERAVVAPDLREVAVERVFTNSMDDPPVFHKEINPTVDNRLLPYDEFQLGVSWYDLQTNSLTENRIITWPDGTIGAVWTYGVQSPPGFPDRGTGYNYYDGSAWGPEPTSRIETDRTGWPCIAPFGEDGELVCAHVSGGSADGLLFNYRETKGAGAWTEFILQGPPDHEMIFWPRMVTTGANHEEIHVISLTAPSGNGGTPYQGQDGALLYSRSLDGGSTWDIQNQLFDALDSDNYTAIRGDNYMWAEPRANTLAFMVADPWMDLALMKSTDNGDTWEKTIVWEHPYPFFDWNITVTDTFYCPDNSGGLALDNNGMAHIVFGIGRVAHFEVGNTYTFWPYTDGVAYWNETMPGFSNDLHALDPWGHPDSELIEDYNLAAWTQDVNQNGTIDFLDELMSYRELGISTMPELVIPQDSNFMALFFSSTTEGYDNGTYNFKHIWVRLKWDDMGGWQDFEDLNTDLIHIFDECIFPHAAPDLMGGDFHLFYNIDTDPGLAWSEDHPWQENKITYIKVPSPVIPGMDEHAAGPEGIQEFRIFPNPASGSVSVGFNTSRQADVAIEVSDLTGQKIMDLPLGKLQGAFETTVEIPHIPDGLYFLSVRAGNSLATEKLIVRKDE